MSIENVRKSEEFPNLTTAEVARSTAGQDSLVALHQADGRRLCRLGHEIHGRPQEVASGTSQGVCPPSESGIDGKENQLPLVCWKYSTHPPVRGIILQALCLVTLENNVPNIGGQGEFFSKSYRGAFQYLYAGLFSFTALL